MPRYANSTDVTPEQSRTEIERALVRYGATAFAYGWDRPRNRALIEFTFRDRNVRLEVRLPAEGDEEALRPFYEQAVKTKQSRQPQAVREQAIRQRWRAMLLYIKACLEAIDSQVIEIEDVFLPGFVRPDGLTVKEWAGPGFRQLAAHGRMPPLLPGGAPDLEDRP